MVYRRWMSGVGALLMVAGVSLPGYRLSPSGAASVTVVADFGAPVDYPLVKTKFGVFNSCIVPLSRYRRDMHVFSEVHPDSLRIDGGLGGAFCAWLAPFVTGSALHPRYNFTEADQLISLLNGRNVLPYWSYDYMPETLQPVTGDYKSPPMNLPAWQAVLHAFAAHFRATGHRVGYQEIYNEPDNRDFWSGTEDNYLRLFDYGARGIKAGDPDAVVVGPALAFTNDWVPPFLDDVRRRQLPLDAFSFHFYGTTNYDNETIAQELDTLHGYFARRPYVATTEWNLNEYNSYAIDYPQGGDQDKFGLASALLNDFDYFIAQPELTAVHWAQFLDSGQGNYSGMISIDGHRKAVFNAYKIYTMMPIDRYQMRVGGLRKTLTGNPVQGMASADDHRATVVLWNRTGYDQPLNVSLKNVPFARGAFRVYRIDADHSSWGDNPKNELLIPTETHSHVNIARLTWSGSIPSGGVVYLEADDGSGLSELTPNPVARVVRTLHYYPDRSTTAYADVDRNTWIARLGMGKEGRADAEVGVTAEGLPRALTIATKIDGVLHKEGPNSLLGLRIDYQVNGAYTKSVLFHGPYNGGVDVYDVRRAASMPWGTGRHPDHALAVSNLARFTVVPRAYAPTGWSGRAQITFIMQDTGVETRAKMTVRVG